MGVQQHRQWRWYDMYAQPKVRRRDRAVGAALGGWLHGSLSITSIVNAVIQGRRRSLSVEASSPKRHLSHPGPSRATKFPRESLGWGRPSLQVSLKHPMHFVVWGHPERRGHIPS